MPTTQPETAHESAEREAARRRGEELARRAAAGAPPQRDPFAGHAPRPVAERAFAALADNVRDYAIFLLDPDGVITFWGESARLIKWWSREQAEGAHLRLLYPDGGAEDGTAEAHLETAARTGEYTGEGQRVRSDGSTFWAGITLTRLRDEAGAVRGFVKVTRDLTAKRGADAAREASLQAAEDANRLKSQFLATVSHEVRTPLTSIMAYTDLMQMELAGPLAETYLRYLATIRSSSQHLLGVIDDILDISRTEAGRLAVARTSVRIGTVLGQTLPLVEPQARRREVEIVDAVSGTADEYRCWGDEDRLRQILLNLLGNAIKFTEAGGRITVTAGQAAEPPPGTALDGDDGPWVYVRVEDTGAGIPAERLSEIFEPFVQADMSTTRQHGGTGLGLAISRRLARLMSGDVTVRSNSGVGSAFFLWLPAASVEPAAAEPVASDAPAPAGAAILHEVREAVLSDLERILHAYVARLRSDDETPHARALPEAELEDHLASFLADIAQTLGSMQLGAGARSQALRDGSAIQRTIAERHGRQRAVLGWAEGEVQREFAILREEIEAAVRRRVRRPRPEEIDEVMAALLEFLEHAETIALTTWRQQVGA